MFIRLVRARAVMREDHGRQIKVGELERIGCAVQVGDLELTVFPVHLHRIEKPLDERIVRIVCHRWHAVQRFRFQARRLADQIG